MEDSERDQWRGVAEERVRERYSWDAVTDAYEELVRRHQAIAFRTAYLLAGNESDGFVLEAFVYLIADAASFASVGSRSMVAAHSRQTVPAGILPGQRAMKGTRSPPSQSVLLAPRSGALPPLPLPPLSV